ncbi:MCE family protein [Amycolatopsis nigrescens]|uniref:MCE family protein n=1 Tax=Amycolatopsis nigrescens TaxID=381445 RepID=UPI00037D6AC0|nr:MCE family protein [Amycolatopsis nigrescens]
MRRAFLLVLVLLAGGCGGMYDVPLPGGADLGPRPYSVKVLFTGVSDLVPQASVKVNDVGVGRVDDIALAADNHTAEVTVTLNASVVLPANATGRLRQSSLLGEKFVDLSPPAGEPPQGRLAAGAVIGLDRTARNTEIEQVLGALSLLVNGGGIEQAQSIATELNAALSGNEGRIRSVLSNVNTLARTLDGQKASITAALDGVARLSGTLAGQRDTIAGALDDLAPGLRVLTEQRDQLVGMLQAVDELSGVAVDTVHRSRDDLVADLRALAPTLGKLAEAGDALPKSLQLLFTYPLPDSIVDAVKGDYVNGQIKADLKLDELLGNLGSSPHPVLPLPGTTPTPNPPAQLPGSAPPLPLPPAAPAQGSLVGDLLGGLLGGL